MRCIACRCRRGGCSERCNALSLDRRALLSLGAGKERRPPQGFRVAQKHGYELNVHYHRVAQFQLVVAGGGRLGRHALHRGAVHYADPLSPYGPIEPGPDSVTYLTLRADADSGAWHMPASRTDLAAARDFMDSARITGRA